MIRTLVAQPVLSSRATQGICFLFFCLFLLALPVHAQVITGTPPFGSFGGGPDVINLANLNAHLTIPVLSKPGRGLPFTFYLTYESSVWYPLTAGGSTSWQNAPNWGWGGSEVNVGTVVSRVVSSSGGTCGYLPHLGITFTTVYGWTYVDGFGTPHPFADTSTVYTNSCTGGYTTGFNSDEALDDSGYSLTVNGSTVTSLYSADGSLINTTAGSIEDRNGNEITESGGVFTDTLGTTALTIAGTAPNPVAYSYTAPSTGLAKYTVNYAQYTVATNFGLSTVHEFGATSEPLVSSVVLPDGSEYTFLYEATPLTPSSGACTPLSGTYQTNCVTARVTRITLPTGGAVNYSYVNGYNGILPDGSAATLQRVTPDGTWTYSQVKNTGAASTTTITDPSSGGNQTVINFQGIYETVRSVYQGTATSGTLLRTWFTCYNAESGNCPSTAITPPITQRVVTDIYGTSGSQSMHEFFYNASGGLYQQLDYDYGPSSPGALLRTTVIKYASLPPNITAFRQTVTVCNGTGTNSACNGNGTVVAQTNYNYDQGTPQSTSGITQHVSVSSSRGNLTSINYPVSGLTANFTYYDTGVPYTSQDVNGATTTYNYSSTNNAYCNWAFPTSITEPLSMSRSMTWNCTGGVQLTSKDENGNTTTTDWTDAYFWRPADVKFPDGGQTTWAYNSPTQVTATTKMNSSQNVVATLLLDSLGRSKQRQLNSDPEGAVYQDTTYDALGRVYTTSNPYRTTSDPTYGLTTTIYDALSRPCAIIPPDGTSLSTCPTSQPTNDIFATYSGNTATVTDQAGKKRTSTFDSLGRLLQVLEDPSGNNYETDYGYDALGDLLCVGQKGTNSGSWSGCGSIPSGWRARTFVYDAMSRLTSETNPESGTVTYHYDASPNQGDLTSRVAPAPNQTGSNTVTTTYAYDALHRLTQKSYSDGVTPSDVYTYDISSKYGATFQNPIGRMVLAERSCSSLMYSFDPMGRVIEEIQDTYLSCTGGAQASALNYSYDLAGDMSSYTNGAGVTFTETFDGAARATTLSSSFVDSYHPATLASVNSSSGYYPFGSLRMMTLGNNLTETHAFNNTLEHCRININYGGVELGSCSDPVPTSTNIQDFATTYNAGSANNGNVASWTGAGWQAFSRTYSYESLNRLSTMADSNTAQQCRGLSWTYDAWGNRTNQTVTAGTCPTFSQAVNAQNQFSGSPYQYDAAGNLIADGNHTYMYDAENRLIQVDSTGGYCSAIGNTATATACYVYDALGRRSVKIPSSGVWAQYFYDLNSNVVAEFADVCGAICWTNGYVYFNGSLLAEYENSSTDFIHKDHLGSAHLLTDVTGYYLTQCLDYLPFGEQASSSEACPNNAPIPGTTSHEFTGDQRDSETAEPVGGSNGLDHTLFRQYSSNSGRWLTPDPAGLAAVDPTNPQSWNRYAYVLNNPLAGIDPSGLYCVYLNDKGDGVESIDDTGGSGDCDENGGYWIAGEYGPGSQISINTDLGLVSGYGYIDGSLQYSVAGATDSNAWGAWTQTVGGPASSDSWNFGSLLNFSWWDLLRNPISGTALTPVFSFGPEASVGMGPTLAYNPRTGTGCYGVAAAAMVPAGGHSGSIGPLTVGNLGNADAILVGGSVFAGAQSENPAAGKLSRL